MGIIQQQTPSVSDLRAKLIEYRPYCLQEAKDKDRMIFLMDRYTDIFSRQNEFFHFTASSWILNHKQDKVLMVYHNIYDSWSWTGGHADGDADLCTVALREAYEETGIFIPMYRDDIFSIEALSVKGHMKNGGWVGSHIHLNVTYLFSADDTMPIQPNYNENSGVKWIPINEVIASSTEPEMRVVYEKLINKLNGVRMY